MMKRSAKDLKDTDVSFLLRSVGAAHQCLVTVNDELESAEQEQARVATDLRLSPRKLAEVRGRNRRIYAAKLRKRAKMEKVVKVKLNMCRSNMQYKLERQRIKAIRRRNLDEEALRQIITPRKNNEGNAQ